VNRFAFANARTISEAAVAASTTVANAMTISPEAAGHGEISVVKAGGIDLLDLLKEGLLAPAMVVNLKEVPGLDAIVEDDAGGLRIGPMVTLASLADHRLLRERYAPSPRSCAARRVHKSAMLRRWAATCCSVRAAGTFARVLIAVYAKAAATVSQFRAKTSITRSSTMRFAQSFILLRSLRRWWPWMRKPS